MRKNGGLDILGALLLLMFVACTDGLQTGLTSRAVIPGQPITIRATVGENPLTKTTVQSDGKSIWWMPNDAINVYYGTGSAGQFVASTLTEASSYAEFTGTLGVVTGSNESGSGARKFWGIYPYDAENTCDGNSVTLTIPSTQEAAAHTFANNLNPTVACSTGLDLVFYNVGSWFIFSVSQEGVTAATLRGNNFEDLVGKLHVEMDADGKPASTMLEGGKSIRMEAPQGGFVPGTLYYMVLMPQTLSKGYTLTLEKGQQRAECVVSKSAEFVRSNYRRKLNADAGLTYSSNINFADPLVKSICVENWDTDSDGELSYAEAAAVTGIGTLFQETGITSFDEFRFFTGVLSLGLYHASPELGTFKGCNQLTSIILPERVTNIGSNSFSDCSSLTSIIIPTGVTEIQPSTFKGCTNLTSISIPATITKICGNAFEDCVSLASINIPEGITGILGSSFRGCSSLTNINIPEGVTSIGNLAFAGCSSLTDIDIPEGVTSIGMNAFKDCSSLTSIEIPTGVTEIQSSTFRGCTNLASVSIPSTSTLTSIGYCAFDGCTKLKGVVLPEGLTSIGIQAFRDCSSLEEIVIPSGVTKIEDYTFSACTSLAEVSIPSGVTSIGVFGFWGCTSLASINLPESVNTIGDYIFSGCSNLSEVSMPSEMNSIGRSAFYNCASLTGIVLPSGIDSIGSYTFFYCSSLTNIDIPEGVTSIGNNAFEGCSSLTNINIPEGVTSIGMTAFANCSSLTAIVLPASVTSIGASAFAMCSSLTAIVLPASVTSIGAYAFYQCSNLTSLEIPVSVTEIGKFAFYNLTSCTAIKVLPTTPPTLGNSGSSVFYGSTCNIQVPKLYLEAYKAAENWSDIADRIVAMDGPDGEDD